MDINAIDKWCFDNYMDTNVGKISVIFFSPMKYSIYFKFRAGDKIVLRSECVKDLSVMLDSKLYFKQHVRRISSQALLQ
jgi:hypothetical protein